MTDINVHIPTLQGALNVVPAPTPPADPAPVFDPTPWKDGVEKFRTAAKWVIGAFGAIGAIVAAAVPFAAISNVSPDSRGVVMWGAGLALGGVAIAIAAAAATLIPRTVYAHEITTKRRWIRRRTLAHTLAVHPDSVLPAGITSYASLRASIGQLTKAIPVAPPPLQPSLKATLATLEATLQGLQWYRRFEKARSVYRVALAAILLGAVATGLGIGLLLYGLHDNKADAETDKLRAEIAQINANVEQVQQQTVDLKSHPPSELQAANIDKIEADIKKVEADIAKVKVDTAQVQEAIDNPPDGETAEKLAADLENLKSQTAKLEAETDQIRAAIAAAQG